jgi:cytochrome c peroxidase
MRWTPIAILAGIAGAALILGAGDAATPVPEMLAPLDPARLPWPEGEPATAAQIALGKQLFFDPRLSANRTMSCASCHDPRKGFSDGLPTGKGVHGDRLARATPPLSNVGFGTLFFWDGRAASLEEQALGPVTNPKEMDLPLEQILPRLAPYRTAFAAAYPDGGLDLDHVRHALASFERTLVSSNSPFDRYARGDHGALTPQQQRGMRLFAGEAGCVACHRGPRFTTDSFQNIGLANQSDAGRGGIMPGATLHAAFKTPSLRNVALTAPYFHDGSAKTLAEVVAFYNRGGDDAAKTPLVTALGLSAPEQEELIAFLEALTDPITVTAPELPPDE